MTEWVFTANDNSAGQGGQGGQSSQTRGHYQSESMTEGQHPSAPSYQVEFEPKWNPLPPERYTTKPVSSLTYISAALSWVAAISANMAAIMFAPTASIHLLIIISAILASLAMLYAAHSKSRMWLSEMASLCTILSFALALYATSLRFGIFISPQLAAALIAFCAICINFVTASPIALRISALATLCWAGLSVFAKSTNITALNLPTPDLAWIGFPALLALQSYAASKHKDSLSLNSAIVAAYILWIAGLMALTLNGSLTPIMAMCCMLVAGLLHSRLGKLTDNEHSFAGSKHTLWGSSCTLAALIALQDYWSAPNSAHWLNYGQVPDATASNLSTLLWTGFGYVSLVFIILFQSARKSEPQGRFTVKTMFQGVSLALLTGAVCYISAYPHRIAKPLAAYGLEAVPMVGIILGGAALSLSFALCLKGLRRKKFMTTLIGSLFATFSFWRVSPYIMNDLTQMAIYGIAAFLFLICIASFVSFPKKEVEYDLYGEHS